MNRSTRHTVSQVLLCTLLAFTNACVPIFGPDEGMSGTEDTNTEMTEPPATGGPLDQPSEPELCGDVTLYGKCDQGILSYCSDRGLEQIDCRADTSGVNLDCMLIDQEWGFDCAAPLGGTCAIVEEEVVHHCAGGDQVGCVQDTSDWHCQDSVGTCDPSAFSQKCIGDVLVIYCSDAGQPLGSNCSSFGLTCRQDTCYGARQGEFCNEFVDCEDGFVCGTMETCEVASSQPNCQRDSDCATGQFCAAGRCSTGSAPPECDSDEECRVGEQCIQGMCQTSEPPECEHPLGFLTIYNNEDADLFVNTGCTSVRGNVYISGAVDDLTRLAALREIGGNLTIQRTSALNTLQGLNALENIGGELVLIDNERLVDLNALGNLQEVHDNIAIVSNPYIESLRGLDNARLIEGIVSIKQNDNLTSLSGMGGLGDPLAVNITENPKLTSLQGFAFGTNMQGGLHIMRNDSLSSLDGLSRLQTVNVLSIIGNISLERISLPSLTFVEGILGISSNSQLSSIDFPSLRAMDARVEIERNPLLSSCAVDDLAHQLRMSGWTGQLKNNGNDMSMDCQ